METYYHSGDLAKFAEVGKGNKELWGKFQTYYAAVFAEGPLTEREKALLPRRCGARSERGHDARDC
jgi:4-carboxymuconolactone decarboxylase